MASINRQAIAQKIASSVAIEATMHKRIYARFEEAKKALIEEFNNHSVTREIEGGVDSPNLSGTLGGGRGNLFTYIGFADGSQPTETVRDILRDDIVLFKVNKSVQGEKIRYQYRVIVPEKVLREQTPMPFETGNSWLYSIETGISGFSNYIYGRFNTPSPSRSGGAIQSKYSHIGGIYIPVPYIRTLLAEFASKVGGAL